MVMNRLQCPDGWELQHSCSVLSLYIWNSVLHVIVFYEEFDRLDSALKKKKMLIMYEMDFLETR